MWNIKFLKKNFSDSGRERITRYQKLSEIVLCFLLHMYYHNELISLKEKGMVVGCKIWKETLADDQEIDILTLNISSTVLILIFKH